MADLQLDGYNWLIKKGIPKILEHLSVQFENENLIEINFTNPRFTYPLSDRYKDVAFAELKNHFSLENMVKLPSEYRENKDVYSCILMVNVNTFVNGTLIKSIDFPLINQFPIMVRSEICLTKNFSNLSLINEDKNDHGGYFIANGQEKVVLIKDKKIENKYFVRKLKFANKQYEGVEIYSSENLSLRRFTIIKNKKVLEAEIQCMHKKDEFESINLYTFAQLMDQVFPEYSFAERLLNIDSDIVRKTIDESNPISFEDAHSIFLERFSNVQGEDVAIEMIKKYFLPHSKAKDVIFENMVNRLLQTIEGDKDYSNPNNINKKYILTSGLRLFKHYRNVLVSQLRLALTRTTNSMSTQNIITTILKVLKNNREVNKAIKYIRSNVWDKEEGAIQVLQTNSLIERKTIMSKIYASSNVATKIIEPRLIHPTSWSFICPASTPESSTCGITKHLTMFCNITNPIEDTLKNNIEKIIIDFINLSKDGVDIYYNNDYYGKIDLKYFHKMLKMRRENHLIHRHTSISLFKNIVYISTKEGRMIAPFIHKKTKKVEWLDPPMVTTIKIGKDYTMYDPRQIFSFETNMLTHIEHNPPARVTLATKHGRSVMQVPFNNYKTRFDREIFVPTYRQRPVIESQTSREANVSHLGQTNNMLVAVMSGFPKGFDQEDAFMVRRGWVQRGGMHVFTYKLEEFEIIKDFKVYPQSIIKQFYEYQDETYEWVKVKPELFVDHRWLINGKHVSKDKPRLGKQFYQSGKFVESIIPLEEFKIVDVQTIEEQWKIIKHGKYYFKKEANVKRGDKLFEKEAIDGEKIIVKTKIKRGIIDRLIVNYREDGFVGKIIIRYRVDQELVEGDKIAFPYAQKGLVGHIFEDWEAPYTESGLMPDIIINSLNFPSRNTMGMFIEMIRTFGILCNKKSGVWDPVDMKPFKLSQEMIEIMKDSSLKVGSMYTWSNKYRPKMKDNEQLLYNTMFRKKPVDHRLYKFGEKKDNEQYFKMMEDEGYSRFGIEMFNPTTGKPFKTKIILGACSCFRLVSYVEKTFSYIDDGYINPRTGEVKSYINGKNGKKLEKMSVDAILAHGAPATIHERLVNFSTGIQRDFCTKCKTFASFHNGYCEYCASESTKVKVNSSRTLNIFDNYCSFMGYSLKFET